MILKKYSKAVSVLIVVATIYFSFYALMPKVVTETNFLHKGRWFI